MHYGLRYVDAYHCQMCNKSLFQRDGSSGLDSNVELKLETVAPKNFYTGTKYGAFIKAIYDKTQENNTRTLQNLKRKYDDLLREEEFKSRLSRRFCSCQQCNDYILPLYDSCASDDWNNWIDTVHAPSCTCSMCTYDSLIVHDAINLSDNERGWTTSTINDFMDRLNFH
jgi:hypothetical protein